MDRETQCIQYMEEHLDRDEFSDDNAQALDEAVAKYVETGLAVDFTAFKQVVQEILNEEAAERADD